jgi:hypothetical protein
MTTTLDAAAYPAIVQLAAQTGGAGVPPEWYLAIFALESGLQPGIGNSMGYVGLNQLSSAQLQSIFHVAPADYLTWPASRQITQVITPWYTNAVKIALNRAPRSLGALYAINLAPGIVQQKGDDPSVVLYASGSAAYAANKPLDFNGDGAITISDLDAFLAKVQARAPYTTALPLLKAAETPANAFPWKTAIASAALVGVAGTVAAHILGWWTPLALLGLRAGESAEAEETDDTDAGETPLLESAEEKEPACPASSEIQSLLFPRDGFTPKQAAAWAVGHGFVADVIDVKPETLRIRQADPEGFSRMRTITLDPKKNVRAIVGWKTC